MGMNPSACDVIAIKWRRCATAGSHDVGAYVFIVIDDFKLCCALYGDFIFVIKVTSVESFT